MKAEQFKELLEELDANSVKTLAEKNSRYAQNGDCLHNFRSGADIVGGTPAQACWGYLTKHLVALRDMVNRNDFSNREDFLEKCQDTINYVRFLWCIGNDNIVRPTIDRLEFPVKGVVLDEQDIKDVHEYYKIYSMAEFLHCIHGVKSSDVFILAPKVLHLVEQEGMPESEAINKVLKENK